MYVYKYIYIYFFFYMHSYIYTYIYRTHNNIPSAKLQLTFENIYVCVNIHEHIYTCIFVCT